MNLMHRPSGSAALSLPHLSLPHLGLPRLGLFLLFVGVLAFGATLHADERLEGRREAARELSATIDHYIGQRWQEEEVSPASPASDAEFLRRVYLDLAGKIPPASEARRFLADSSPDKRRALVEQLLESPSFAQHFAQVWTYLLIPEAQTDLQLGYISLEFRAWLLKKLDEGAGYDAIAREILTVPLARNGRTDAYAFYSNRTEATPTAFFAAKQIQPENLAAATARVFMGLRVDCAQCHDHPFADWSQEQFWGYAAFFNGIQRDRNQPFGALVEFFQSRDPDELEITIPDTNRSVKARFLDGRRPESLASGPRQALAEWLLARDNPYFARAVANRVWAIYFGMGIVDPVDDMDLSNAPSHPELLGAMATTLAENQYDLKVLIQAITLSRAYQLSSRLSDATQQDPRLFARMLPKKLSAEQVVASLQQAIGAPVAPQANGYAAINAGFSDPLRQLFEQSEERSTEGQTSVLQALAMMNGPATAQGTSLEQSGLLSGVAEMPWLSLDQKVETLFFAALSRPPTDAERERLGSYVESGGPSENPQEALADVFWALLNSSEFLLNH